MQNLPFRTHETWLTDGQLVLLDGFFHWQPVGDHIQIPSTVLREKIFGPGFPFDLDYSHGYDDEQLNCHLRWLCEHGVLEMAGDSASYRLTIPGFELWEAERNPPWERFCRLWPLHDDSRSDCLWYFIGTPSPQIREDFLRLLEPRSLQQRSSTNSGESFLCWRSFPTIYCGAAKIPKSKFNKYLKWLFKRKRTWWTRVSELFRFLPPAGASDPSTI